MHPVGPVDPVGPVPTAPVAPVCPVEPTFALPEPKYSSKIIQFAESVPNIPYAIDAVVPPPRILI